MSASLASIYDSVSYALNLHAQALSRLQEQTATGNRVNRGSDSPSDAYRILGLNTQDRTLDGYKDTIADIMGMMEVSSTVIGNMATEVADTQTVLTEIVGGVYDEEGQKRIADKINNTLEQLVSLANTKHAGQYLFGGGNTSQAPYAVQREGGQIVAVTYQGAGEGRSVDVAAGVQVEAYQVGDDIFRMSDRQTPVFLGDTGAKAGTGTSNVTGDVWLTVEYDGTNYQVSIDNGATFVTVPEGGDPNQAVVDSRTGRVLYVDTTGIESTGQELVRVPGTYDVFGTLISLRDMLLNERGLSSQQLSDLVNKAAAAVEEIHTLLVQSNVSTGSKVGFLTSLNDTLENMQYNTQDETTRLQEADIAQIAIDLSRREVLYQMSLSVAGQIMSTSLLDYIG
jgi:flagellar hook-associated protein 3 FlgL